MRPPRWLLVAILLATDAVAIWAGIADAVAASFLLVLAGVSATLALTVRARAAAGIGLALLVPATFLAVMAGPGGAADCGPGCAALVEAHDAIVSRVAWVLAIGHAVALVLAHYRWISSPIRRASSSRSSRLIHGIDTRARSSPVGSANRR